jgi:hypothetical protein
MTDFSLTSNLSLKKPIPGGSDGKWGEYINENLETIGAAVVSLQNASTSRTLESLSNVLDLTPTTGQLLQFSGSNWSTATVTIPDNIQDLTNVTVTSPSDGQVLAYSTSNSRWENQTPGAATIPDGTITNAKLDTSLQGQVALILQTTGTPTDNQIVRYDSTSANWHFEDLPGGTVAALSDTDVSGIANKDVLVYNSTSGNWVSRSLAISDVPNLQSILDGKLSSSDVTISSISDTTITSIVDNSVLVYDSGTSKWVNESPSTFKSTLSLVIGTNVQAQSARLDEIAALTPTDSNIVVGSGSSWVAESGATARASLGVSIGTQVQAQSARLDEIAALTPTDGNFIVGDGTAWVAESGATVRTSLGLGSLATQNTITESQISDLQTYLTAESNDLSSTVTWATVPDAYVSESSVTQHLGSYATTGKAIAMAIVFG